MLGFIVPFLDYLFSDTYLFHESGNFFVANMLNPGQMFALFPVAWGNGSKFWAQDVVFGVGFAYLLVIPLFWYLYPRRAELLPQEPGDANEHARTEAGLALCCAVLGSLALIASTCIIPWALVAKLDKFVGFVKQLQFPYRLLGAATAMLVAVML